MATLKEHAFFEEIEDWRFAPCCNQCWRLFVAGVLKAKRTTVSQLHTCCKLPAFFFMPGCQRLCLKLMYYSTNPVEPFFPRFIHRAGLHSRSRRGRLVGQELVFSGHFLVKRSRCGSKYMEGHVESLTKLNLICFWVLHQGFNFWPFLTHLYPFVTYRRQWASWKGKYSHTA